MLFLIQPLSSFLAAASALPLTAHSRLFTQASPSFSGSVVDGILPARRVGRVRNEVESKKCPQVPLARAVDYGNLWGGRHRHAASESTQGA